MTKQHTITSFNVSWTADHEQYWQGRGIAFTNYTHTATGVGDTLREAFEDAMNDLVGQLLDSNIAAIENDMLAELTSQVKEPEMLDWDIVKGYCTVQGKHPKACEDCLGNGEVQEIKDDCINCDGTGESPFEYDSDPDCAVCAGEWHYYVSIDVTVEGE